MSVNSHPIVSQTINVVDTTTDNEICEKIPFNGKGNDFCLYFQFIDPRDKSHIKVVTKSDSNLQELLYSICRVLYCFGRSSYYIEERLVSLESRLYDLDGKRSEYRGSDVSVNDNSEYYSGTRDDMTPDKEKYEKN